MVHDFLGSPGIRRELAGRYHSQGSSSTRHGSKLSEIREDHVVNATQAT
jgi:hypothetical protein